jgi:hypothetical protein
MCVAIGLHDYASGLYSHATMTTIHSFPANHSSGSPERGTTGDRAREARL